MNLYMEEKTEQVIEGFVSNDENDLAFFPVVREIRMKMFRHDGHIYFRTREASDLLGYKQPFQFVATLKKNLGENSILKGDKTKDFRTDQDTDQSTFIEAEALLRYLKSRKGPITDEHDSKITGKVVKELEYLLERAG